ncbi:MAG: hypothetical protein AB7F28_08855 [Candidatus Margulisiibacteriota bacterium]
MDYQYKGMSVNERLYVSGLWNEFDKVCKDKDSEKAIEILSKIEITDTLTIKAILESMGITEKL